MKQIDLMIALEELRQVGSVVMHQDGRALVITVVPGDGAIRGVLVGYELAGAYWWSVGSDLPDRLDLITAGIPINIAPAISWLLRKFIETTQSNEPGALRQVFMTPQPGLLTPT